MPSPRYRETFDKIETAMSESPESLRPQLESARKNREKILNQIT